MVNLRSGFPLMHFWDWRGASVADTLIIGGGKSLWKRAEGCAWEETVTRREIGYCPLWAFHDGQTLLKLLACFCVQAIGGGGLLVISHVLYDGFPGCNGIYWLVVGPFSSLFYIIGPNSSLLGQGIIRVRRRRGEKSVIYLCFFSIAALFINVLYKFYSYCSW